MTTRDFCYWLQGYFEIENPKTISLDKKIMIKKHLDMVFKHESQTLSNNSNSNTPLNGLEPNARC